MVERKKSLREARGAVMHLWQTLLLCSFQVELRLDALLRCAFLLVFSCPSTRSFFAHLSDLIGNL